MKFRFPAALLLAALSISLLSGCAAQAAAPAPTQPVLTVIEEPAVPLAPAADPTAPPAPVPTEAPMPTEIPASTAAPVVPANPSWITREEAIAIALNHAGLTEEQVIYRRAEFDWDDGQPIYEIDFHSGDREYDYDIHAETGKVLEKESEPDKIRKTESAPAAPAVAAAPAPAPTEAPAPELLTGDEAIAIALKDAGLSRDQVSRLEAEFDRDDGRPEYDVSFRQGSYEYDYEIHAETGKILSRDKEWDD